jgi:hypothetical protein
MRQQMKVLRYFFGLLAVSLACPLVSLAQQAAGGQTPRPAAAPQAAPQAAPREVPQRNPEGTVAELE